MALKIMSPAARRVFYRREPILSKGFLAKNKNQEKSKLKPRGAQGTQGLDINYEC
jgi:hypothetical protein